MKLSLSLISIIFVAVVTLNGCSKDEKKVNDTNAATTPVQVVTSVEPQEIEFKAYIGKSYTEVTEILEKKNINEIPFGMMVLKKDEFLMLVQYAPTGLGSIGSIEIFPNAVIPKELSDATGIDGFDLLAKKYDWTVLEDVKIFDRTYKKDNTIVNEYIAVKFQNIEPNEIISIKTLQKTN